MEGITRHGCISREHPAVPGHFPRNPIIPAAVILTELLRAIECGFGPTIRVLELSSVKFITPLHPGEPFSIRLETVDSHRIKFHVTCDERPIASGTIRHNGA